PVDLGDLGESRLHLVVPTDRREPSWRGTGAPAPGFGVGTGHAENVETPDEESRAPQLVGRRPAELHVHVVHHVARRKRTSVPVDAGHRDRLARCGGQRSFTFMWFVTSPGGSALPFRSTLGTATGLPGAVKTKGLPAVTVTRATT